MSPNTYEQSNWYEEKKFSTVSDCITQALISFIDNHVRAEQIPELFEAYLPDDGKDLMRRITREELNYVRYSSIPIGAGIIYHD
jgi:hypothetical protein